MPRKEEMEIRVAMSGDDFRKLVSGKELVIEHPVTASNVRQAASIFPTVKIILSDIGFDLMRQAIDDAEHEKEPDGDDLLGTPET